MRRSWVLALSLLAPASSRADDGEIDPASRARAEALFTEGLELLEKGDTALACPKLEAAVALTRGDALGGKLVLARCYERAGRTASAWGLYREVGARAENLGQKERAKEALERADALSPRLTQLRLEIAEALLRLPSLDVRIGERALPKGSFGSPLPVDPGELVIELRADGFLPRRETSNIPATSGEVVVKLGGSLERVPVVAPPVAPRRSSDPPSSFWSAQRIIGLGVGVVGVAGLGAGGILGGIAKGNYDDALISGRCSGSPPVCDDATDAQSAEELGNIATVVFFSGASVASLGLVLFLTAPSTSDDDVARQSISIQVGARDVTLQGTF